MSTAPPNRLLEVNSVPLPAGPDNPFANAFVMRETPLRTEREAERDLNLDTSRRWIVVNPNALNALGQPTGYALLPGENAKPFAAADSWVRKRARFLDAHLWVTPYAADEIYAGGDYPNQCTAAMDWQSGPPPIVPSIIAISCSGITSASPTIPAPKTGP